MTMRRAVLLSALALLAACDGGGTEAAESGTLAVRVSADLETPGSMLAASRSAGPRASVAPGGPRRTSPVLPALHGTNGMLVLDHVFFVASGLGLDSGTGACDDGAEHPCTVAPAPFLLWMPHGTEGYELLRTRVSAGEFDAVRFRTDDLDGTGLAAPDRARVDSLLADARLRMPGFPAQAVMGVRGTFFSPTASRSFTVFFRADADVMLPLQQAMRVPGVGVRTVDLRILPARWFRDGNVVQDLSLHDGELLDLTDRFADGFEVRVLR
jgi:hypothetical protein